MYRFAFLVLIALCSASSLAQHGSQPTLKERALRDGYAKAVVYGDCAINCDFDHLLQQSSVIAVGGLRQRSSRLGPDENSVFTDYEFTTTEVIKGAVSDGSILKLTVGGGKIDLGKAVAEVEVGNFPLPIAGNYLLFLYPSPVPGEDGLYRVTFSERGIYRVVNNRTVCHRGYGVDPKLCKIALADMESEIRDRLINLPPSSK